MFGVFLHGAQRAGARGTRVASTNHATTMSSLSQKRSMSGCCHWFEPHEGGDSAWQVDTSTIKYGWGVLREVGEDAWDLGMRKAAVFTDKGLSDSEHLDTVVTKMKERGIDVAVYDEVVVEPTDTSFKTAAQFAREGNFDGFVSLGGGSVMDTCKAASLYATFPNDFLDFVNPPIGKGKLVEGKLRPHIACPTTSGTGSESTGLAIFDLESMHAKTGIASRRIRPDLALVDPLTTLTLPSTIVAASGFDCLSHACESFTARPYTKRTAPAHPSQRPMSQGSNPWSDMGCKEALRLTGEYIERAVSSAEDTEAREKMMFASTLAGIAFGNVGCHMPHGMSYSVSGLVKDGYCVHGYPQDKAMVPHGYSVILNAPSVFRWTADACPDRHMLAAELLGADTRGAYPDDAGEILASRIIELMGKTGVPAGLGAIGYSVDDVDDLTAGAMPQRRLLDNAPKSPTEEDVREIYKGAMKY